MLLEKKKTAGHYMQSYRILGGRGAGEGCGSVLRDRIGILVGKTQGISWEQMWMTSSAQDRDCTDKYQERPWRKLFPGLQLINILPPQSSFIDLILRWGE